MLNRYTAWTAALTVLLMGACAPTAPPVEPAPAPTPPAEPVLPPVPEVRGDLAIDVVYPAAGGTVAAVDSTFIFGNLGHGDAALTINGASVEVAPNGAWLAFLPVPRDGRYELVAQVGDRTERLVHEVQVATTPAIDAAPGRLGVVPGTLRPAGILTGVRGEPIDVRIQATPGARATLILPDGTRVPLQEQPAVVRQEGFGLDRAVAQQEIAEYVGTLRLDQPLLFEDPEADDPAAAVPTLTRGPGYVEPREQLPATGALVELVLREDTLRVPLEASVGVIEVDEPRVAVVDTDRPDSTAVGQLAPGGGQAWEYFWWNGTRLAVDGEAEGFYRVRLADNQEAWVAQGNVRLEPAGTPLPRGDVGPSVAIEHALEWIDFRFHGTDRLPYRVNPSTHGLTVEFYGATGRPGYIGYGGDDTFLDRVHWEQPSTDRFHFHIELKERLWGFRTRWDEQGRLLVQARRAPDIDPAAPFRNVHIGVDAGHPPGGAIGPTRLTEADANLSVTRRMVPMLEQRGARILETRPDTATLGLFDRVMMAHDNDLHMFVSVHFNAFPDGVNPFENNGTIMFYYWPFAVDLARELQRDVVGEMGLRDLGIRFQNLAIPRIWWMPSVLTETLFMMIPEHEAALYNEGVQQRIAEAHVRAMERFLRTVGLEQQETRARLRR